VGKSSGQIKFVVVVARNECHAHLSSAGYLMLKAKLHIRVLCKQFPKPAVTDQSFQDKVLALSRVAQTASAHESSWISHPAINTDIGRIHQKTHIPLPGTQLGLAV